MTLLLLLCLPFLSTGSWEPQGNGRDLVGNWYSEDLDQSTISITQVAQGLWHARIVNSANKESIGKALISGMRLSATRNEFEGRLTSPKSNMDVTATIVVLPDGRLRVTGKKLFLKKTSFWTKVTPAPF